MIIDTIIVDDDRFALNELERLLSLQSSFKIIGKYLDPTDVLDSLDTLEPQVVFLDINMPVISGLGLAMKLREKLPDLIIVFTSAYDEFAIEAFRVYALDYLLKPISGKRFEETVKRIVNQIETIELLKGTSQSHNQSKNLVIKTFGKLEVGFEGREPIKWRTEKIKELFAFLLHNANKEISKDVLLNMVFNRGNLDNSIHQLHNSIYYIKCALANYGIDKKQIDITGKYMLKIDVNLVDSFRFKQSFKQQKNQEFDSEKLRIMEESFLGDYLEDIDTPWIYLEREYFRRQYMEVANHLSGIYLDRNMYLDAEDVLVRAYNRDPYLEDITIKLLKIYLKTKRNDMAIKHYMNYKSVLASELGIAPDKEVSELIKHLKKR